MVATGTALACRAWRWLLFPAKPRAKYTRPCAKRGAQQLPRGPHERHKNEGAINAQLLSNSVMRLLLLLLLLSTNDAASQLEVCLEQPL